MGVTVGQTAARLLLLICTAQAAIADMRLGDLETGHWVIVKGSFEDSSNRFFAEHILVTQPDNDTVLIGTVVQDRRGALRLLGFELELEEDLKYRDLDPDKLDGVRVKAEGDWRGGQRFEVESLSARGSGRERLEGPLVVSTLGTAANYSVLGVPLAGLDEAQLATEGQRSLASFSLTEPAALVTSIAMVDDDDEFGSGLALGRYLRLTPRVEMQSSREDNFNFDAGDNEDRQDVSVGLRSRVNWRPGGRFSGVTELRLNHRRREQQDEPNSKRTEAELGETWVQARLSDSSTLTVGRQDFDDPREWLFDSNLDAVRLAHSGRRLNLQASLSKRIDNDGSRQANARNLILYLSNVDDDRHVAGYMIQRKFGRDEDESSLHVGGRVAGDWLPDFNIWLEAVHQSGRRQQRDINAWAVDTGMTWFPLSEETLYLTAAAAYATGDDPDTPEDETFRQTGLQDNNGKFGGITSFRYYGELSDPELSNMMIATLGAGTRPSRNLSIDLVGHAYHLNKRAEEVTDSEWDADLTGEARFLGWEADLIIGLRGQDRWSVEAVLGYFEPGPAFEDRDASYFGKLQLRVRI